LSPNPTITTNIASVLDVDRALWMLAFHNSGFLVCLVLRWVVDRVEVEV
jgi:hypothetical protein